MKQITSGLELKQKLGLSEYRYVSYSRILGLGYQILIIYYSSSRPNIPITDFTIRNTWNIVSVKRLPFTKEMSSTPVMPLEYFDGNLAMTVAVTVDLSGWYGDKSKQVPKNGIKESVINEWLTFKDLKTLDSISKFTYRFKKERDKLVKTENFLAKLIDCVYNNIDDSVIFIFTTRPTFSPNKPTIITDPDNSFRGTLSSEDKYTVQIKILDFMKWLKETRPDNLSNVPISWKEIKDVLYSAYIQISCNCMSFVWQGISYWLTQLDGAIYANNIEPKRWNAPHLHGDGNAFLCKHSWGIINQIDFFANQMASKLNKTLKEKGLING